MRVVAKKLIVSAMERHPQWDVGIKLWYDSFEAREVSFESFNQIREMWKAASGWNTDRIPARQLTNSGRKGPLDMYVFDIHKNDCRLLAWAATLPGIFYVNGVYSHAEYDKWCKANTK